MIEITFYTLFGCTLIAELHGQDKQSSDCFEYLQNPYLNQATPKNLPNFPTQKNPRIQNFKLKKILWSSPLLKIQSMPPCPSQTQSQIVQLAAVSLIKPSRASQ